MKLDALFFKAEPKRSPRSPKARVTARSAPATPLPAIPLPADIQARLVALRRRYRFVFAATGLFMVAGAWSALFLAQGLADWWFDLPWLARAAFLAVDIALLVSIYLRHLHRPLRKKLGLPQTALMVEKKWPSLRQSLITAVEMSDGGSGATRGSLQLVDTLMQQASARTTNLNFKDVVPVRAVRRWALWGSLAMLGTLGVAAYGWPASGVLLKRILLSTVPLPTKTIVVALTEDMTVPVSTDVEISARAEGYVPSHGRVTVTYEEGPPQEFPLTVLPDQPGTFALTVHNVQRPFKYRFYLNDGHGPEFTVTAKVPPAISTLECTVVYPDYTHLPPQKLPSTTLTLLAGSHLRLKAGSTVPLQSATVLMKNGDKNAAAPIAIALDGTKKQLQVDVPIPAKDLTGFALHLVDEAGLASVNETVYPIDLVPDHPPVVKILTPANDSETITLRAKPVFTFDASDDYGIIAITLNYELVPPIVAGQEDVKPVVSTQKISIKVKSAGEGTHYDYTLDVAAQTPAWQTGWTVNYWLEAVDNNTATGPGITKTDRKQFGIISPEAKQAEILERMKQNAAEIDTLSDTQQQVSHDVGEAIPKK